MLTAIKEACGVTPTEKRSARRYRYEFLGASLLYIVLAFVQDWGISRVIGVGKYFVAFLPALGIIAMTVALVRFVLRMDELQRQTMINAAAFSAVITAVVCPALSFLGRAGLPYISLFWVYPIALLAWFSSMPYFRHRFR